MIMMMTMILMTMVMIMTMKIKTKTITPEEDPMPEDPKPPCDPNVSSPWSLLASPHKARAPFNESIDGVGDVISPDFCLTCMDGT